jgi:hypothetical protein
MKIIFLSQRAALLLSVVCCMALSNGCESYIGGTTNVDPTRPAEVDLRTMLPAIQLGTANAYYNVGVNSAIYTQQLANIVAGSADTQIPTALGDAWTNIYLDALTNADRMVKQANELCRQSI